VREPQAGVAIDHSAIPTAMKSGGIPIYEPSHGEPKIAKKNGNSHPAN